jgi:GAF domain-containing protein
MTKQEKYEAFLPQLQGLIDETQEAVSVLANVCAALHAEFGWWWTGFYLVRGNKLVLGPFQGPVACYQIPFGRGVCGSAWKEQKTLVVPDVEEFPGHIACSSLSRSEIVVPVFDEKGEVCAVLDIDSKELACFDETDRLYLERAMQSLAKAIYQ